MRPHLQSILPRTKFYTATGLVVEAVLTKILDDVLALPDIPEVDSRKLSELCRILNALEGLFVDAGAGADVSLDSVSVYLVCLSLPS